jgi:predicted transcriptional regulator
MKEIKSYPDGTRVTVRLLDEEKEQLQDTADKTKRTMSQTIREALFGHKEERHQKRR